MTMGDYESPTRMVIAFRKFSNNWFVIMSHLLGDSIIRLASHLHFKWFIICRIRRLASPLARIRTDCNKIYSQNKMKIIFLVRIYSYTLQSSQRT